MSVRILIGDMRERLKELADNSVDSVVCDPPYHLTSIVKRFGKSQLEHKSSKDLTKVKAPQYKRLARGFMGQQWDGGDVAFDSATWESVLRVLKPGAHLIAFSGTRTYHRMAVAIEDAGFEIRDQLAWVYGSGFPKSHNQPGGWGTALKPAWEPIALARKPLDGTVAANMAKHGTGALNIDATRIQSDDNPMKWESPRGGIWSTDSEAKAALTEQTLGRWPANLCHDGSDEVLAGFPADAGSTGGTNKAGGCEFFMGGDKRGSAIVRDNDSGSAARFFYCAKTTTDERGEGNNHPTVKPVALMRWLVRLVTPKGGTVLDPFMGSGSTALACDAEQFNFIGCELSPEYGEIARKRIADAAGMFAEIEVCHAGPETRAA